MDRNQLIHGIIIVGAGILLLLLAGEIYNLDHSDILAKATSLIIRFASYICIVAGCILSIHAAIPKNEGNKK